jgi:D-arginine dehydrogenase
MRSAQFVIVGAGFAGAATAYHLARQGARNILLVEQETVAGYHSSGRNASLIRQVISEESTMVLAVEGAAFLRRLPEKWLVPVSFEQNGSMLLAGGKVWEGLQRDAAHADHMGIKVELLSPQEAKARIVVLDGARFEGALWCPSDGVVDIHALLSGYLKAAASLGVEIRYNCRVKAIEKQYERIARVLLEEDWVATDVLVNAAGAWAGTIGNLAGGAPVGLRPLRRHLFVTGPLPWVDKRWPFVWDVSHGFYFRPDSGGLLLCPCDEAEMPPGDTGPVESALELLAEKARNYFPQFADLPIMKSWAGLRTFAPDGRFVIGWDPGVGGLFWVAGLGGHGVTTSGAVGALAATLLLGGEARAAEALSPVRFVQGTDA